MNICNGCAERIETPKTLINGLKFCATCFSKGIELRPSGLLLIGGEPRDVIRFPPHAVAASDEWDNWGLQDVLDAQPKFASRRELVRALLADKAPKDFPYIQPTELSHDERMQRMAAIRTQLAAMPVNGSAKGGTLFTSTKVAAALLRENGRENDATELEAQAKPGDIVLVQNGEMHLEDTDE